MLPVDSLLSTPSDKDSCTKLEAANARTRKRDAFGQCKDDHESPINTITRFTIGKSDFAKSTNVKRKLVMNDRKSTSIATETNTVPEKKVVAFSKFGNLSPVKTPASFSVAKRNLNETESSIKVSLLAKFELR